MQAGTLPIRLIRPTMLPMHNQLPMAAKNCRSPGVLRIQSLLGEIPMSQG